MITRPLVFLGCCVLVGCCDSVHQQRPTASSTVVSPESPGSVHPTSPHPTPAPSHPSLPGPGSAEGRDITELKGSFSYKGKPLHPFLLEKFLGWISDRQTPVLAVNVASQDGANEFDAPVTNANGEFSAQRTVHGAGGDDVEVVRYTKLGVLADGTIAVQIKTFNQSAPNVRSELLFLGGIHLAYGVNGSSQTVLGLRLIGSHDINVNDNPKFEVKKNGVLVRTDSNSAGSLLRPSK